MSIAPHVLVAVALDGAAEGDAIDLGEHTRHHLERVLRLADGARVSLTDGDGSLAHGSLRAGRVVLDAAARSVPVLQPRLVLAQALSKGRRAEDAVRVACELGVDRIVPVIAARTQGRPDARAEQALVERWRAVAVAALEQSRGTRLAEITPPVRTLAAAAPAAGEALALVAVPGATALPEMLAVAPLGEATGSPTRSPTTPEEVVIAVGPEGGWSTEELAAARAVGWLEVGLGPTVLRTEHAGPVAVAVVAALLGRWHVHPAPNAAAQPAWGA